MNDWLGRHPQWPCRAAERRRRSLAHTKRQRKAPPGKAGTNDSARRTKAVRLAAASAALAALAVSMHACGGDWCPPENRCGNRCVDLMTDSEHCGACYVRCVHPAECIEGNCEAPCPPTYHDGGDGECVPRGTCSDGFHNGGDGVCVPEGECRPGYRDGGDGTCYPFGACAPGYRHSSDGTCAPEA